jgi:hypothetical protein
MKFGNKKNTPPTPLERGVVARILELFIINSYLLEFGI